MTLRNTTNLIVISKKDSKGNANNLYKNVFEQKNKAID